MPTINNPLTPKKDMLVDTSKLIFNIAIVLYILLDLTERFAKVEFEVWYYFAFFMFIFFAMMLYGVAELERIIMKRLEK